MKPSVTNTGNTACNPQHLTQFLQADHFRLEDAELLAHLDTCTTCRAELEAQAGDTQYWKQASQQLRPHEFDQAGSQLYSAAGSRADVERLPLAIQEVLDALAPTDHPNSLGRIGTHEVTGVVGVGGMGVVLKAIDPSLDRVVAIKVMAPRLANQETARKRFAREAKAAAAVLHPNVIPIHSVSSDQAPPYLVMAYIRGGSLQKRLEAQGPFPLVEILRIGSQIAAGLAAAHEQGLVHRDIKPENILLEEGVERVTITDFGLARAVDDNSVTQAGAIAGTPMYMSPEQAQGHQIDQQSDLFSLGSVLYALSTGRPPYRADTSYGVMRRIIDESPVPIRSLNTEIPAWFSAIVEKLMARQKTDRFASANEVQKLLEACLGHLQQPQAYPLPVFSGVGPRAAGRMFFTSRTGVLAMTMLTTFSLTVAAVLILAENPDATNPSPSPQPVVAVDEPEDKPSKDPASQAGVEADDPKQIQGIWQVTYSEDSGRVAPQEMLKDLRFIITREGLTMQMGERKSESSYTLDPKTSPKSINLTEQGLTKKGIYDLQGDTLRICFAEDTDTRPTAFDSKPDSANDVIIMMKRIKIDTE